MNLGTSCKPSKVGGAGIVDRRSTCVLDEVMTEDFRIPRTHFGVR